ASAEGWLVTGRPVGRPQGIWLVAGESVEPLLTGPRCLGVALDGEDFVFATDLVSDEAGQPFELHRIPRRELERCGPRCRPFAGPDLAAIAERVVRLDDPAPRTAEDVRALLAAADQVAHERAGAPLPREPIGVDGLLTELVLGKD